ncbi:MAG: hypothetical protein P1U68_05965 [Verrucomicrobiales bacterium]|nr:hypothetical protein [Verrucomicrobiales bacterium]
MNPRPVLLTACLSLLLAGLPLNAQEKKGDSPQKSRHQETQAAHPDSRQETRIYHIPPTFTISRAETGKTASDPFSKKNTEAGSGAEQSLRMTFLKAGVELNTDDKVNYNSSDEELTVTTSVTAHRQLEDYFALLKNEAGRQIHILVEFIEVDHLEFSDWMMENRISGDGTPLRKEVQKWIHGKRATILESVMVTARSGQRAKTESISEVVHPTEFSPAEVPATLTQAEDTEPPITPIGATAFETRHVGVTLEVDPVIGADNTTIDLNLAPEMVRLEGHTVWPNEEIDAKFRAQIPTFYTMKTTTQITTLDGRYAFLSTLRPLGPSDRKKEDALVLLFVRADIGSMGEWSVEAE